MDKKIAIIDLGSNSVHVIITKIYENGLYKMIDHVKEMVRLSEGMGEEMTLKEEPMNRTINTLKLFRKLIEAYNVDEVVCTATAAIRRAKNQKEFLERAKMEAGFNIKVISGQEEAYYDYMGVINTIQVEDCVIVDIGGASTEIVWVKNREMKEAISLPFGAVTLTEKFLDKDIINKDKLVALEEYLFEKLQNVAWLRKTKGLPIVGLGGTIRTIAKIDRKKINFPFESLHNYQVTDKEVLYVYERLISTKLTQRKRIPGINKARADIIVGGIAPLKVLIEYLEAEKLIISGNGLREGVFFEKYLEAYYGKSKILEDVLEHRVENLLKRYDSNIIHSYHVRKLALSLFDQMQEIHELSKDERKILSVAAALHDIGMYVDYYNHHKHGFYLALNSRIYGLNNKELVMCSFVIAMHREDRFKENWKKFKMLIDKDDYDKIKILSLFVRIAEKLDRSEYCKIKDIQCNITEESIQLKLISNRDRELEIAAALKYKNEFRKLLRKNLEIIS